MGLPDTDEGESGTGLEDLDRGPHQGKALANCMTPPPGPAIGLWSHSGAGAGTSPRINRF